MDRRTFLAAGAVAPFAMSAGPALAEVTLRDDGLHDQPFFIDSFLELGDDLQEAAAAGKGLMILFEQRGCPYCKELHAVNFARTEVVDYMTAQYHLVQLDLWGAREVTDFDGAQMEERALAQAWGVNFTPTVVLIPPTRAGAQSRSEAEAFRMPGYFKPFHFLSSLEYVASGEVERQPFQRFLQDKFAEFAAKGINPDVW